MMSDFRAELEALVLRDRRYAKRRRALVEAVLATGVRSRADLVAALDAGSRRDDRGRVLEVLTLIGGREAHAAVVKLLETCDPDLCDEALNTVANWRLACAVPAVIQLIRDACSSTRVHAVLVLGSCGQTSPKACDVLLELLADSGERGDVRGGAAEALNGFDDPRVSPALTSVLADPEPEVRYYAAFALSARRETLALPALERAAATETATLPDLGSVRDELLDAIDHIRGTHRERS